jgi:hypothetical protein
LLRDFAQFRRGVNTPQLAAGIFIYLFFMILCYYLAISKMVDRTFPFASTCEIDQSRSWSFARGRYEISFDSSHPAIQHLFLLGLV